MRIPVLVAQQRNEVASLTATAGAAALDAFDAAALDAFGDLARGVPYNDRFQFRMRTSNSQHARVEYTTKERLAHDPLTLPGEAFGAPAT